MLELAVEINKKDDVSQDEFLFVVEDLVNTIKEIITENETVTFKDSLIYIDTTMSKEVLKKQLKPVFSHHFNILRFVDLIEVSITSI